MQVNEQDLEQLELYLDRELTADETASIERRIAVEPALASEIERLRGQRAVRLSAMSIAFDTDAASVERLVSSVRMAQVSEALERRRRFVGAFPARSVFAAAACLAVGLFLGVTLQRQHGGSIVAAPLVNGSAAGTFVGSNVGTGGEFLQGHGAYVVLLRDGDGREVMKLRFNSRAEADAFIRRINNPSAGVAPMHIGDAKILDEPY